MTQRRNNLKAAGRLAVVSQTCTSKSAVPLSISLGLFNWTHYMIFAPHQTTSVKSMGGDSNGFSLFESESPVKGTYCKQSYPFTELVAKCRHRRYGAFNDLGCEVFLDQSLAPASWQICRCIMFRSGWSRSCPDLLVAEYVT
jgi:hypothetical protein